jgi:hypothetical protein
MELANSQNWNLLTSQTLAITKILDIPGFLEYYPIPPLEIRTASTVLMVDAASSKIKPTWHTAGWASYYSSINNAMVRVKTIRYTLNDPTLLVFPRYQEVFPCSLVLETPKWIEEISLTLWEYIDRKGNYFTSEVETLAARIIGQELVLQNASYYNLPNQPDLVETTFTEFVQYSKYEVGRFRTVGDDLTLSDPIIQMQPNRLIVTFTGDKRIQPGTVKVKITEA